MLFYCKALCSLWFLYFYRFLHILDLWPWVWSILIGLESQQSDQLRSKPHNESYSGNAGGCMGPVVVNVAGVVSPLCRHRIDTAIAIVSISTSVYKYVIDRIAISYAAWHVFSAQIREKRHPLLCRSTLYLYLYCIYIVLLYLWSICANKMHKWFTILFYLKQWQLPLSTPSKCVNAS